MITVTGEVHGSLIVYRDFLKKRVERLIIKKFGLFIEKGIDRFINFIADLLNW